MNIGSNPVLTTKKKKNMEERLIKLLLTKWIELKSDDEKKTELLKELENSNRLLWTLGKSTSDNDILGVQLYSPNRTEYSVNLNELINSKQIND